jgi:prophage DNA circulation protein
MGWLQERYPAPWRVQLVPAKFRTAEFKVESNARESGRRVVVHEFPKRDEPYSEDLGRKPRRFHVVGYIITGPTDQAKGVNYKTARDDLVTQLEKEGPGVLQLPTLHIFQVCCEEYSVSETRERGGYCVFEMRFVEAGRIILPTQSTTTLAKSAAVTAQSATAQAFNDAVKTPPL